MAHTTGTTTVRPHDPELQAALRLAGLFAAVTLAFHLAASVWQAHIGYGYFRDEMYYILCGRHLAWGYVDHGPIVAVQARLAETLFGRSLAGIRTFSSLAGALRVGLTGLLAWSLGGRRGAQALAMLAVLLAPQYLAIDGFLSMNSFESPLWMLCLLALIVMERGGSPRSWLLFGLAAGIGLLNKPSMTFFLLALLAALLWTRQRRLLWTPWAAAGVLLLLLLALPNLIWQMQNHWPTWEFLRNGELHHKTKQLAPLSFLAAQVVALGPLNLLVWGPGLILLLRRPAMRWLGLTYVFFLLLMIALHAKDYYVTPIYPLLFAAGGLAWEARLKLRSDSATAQWFAFPILETVLIVTSFVVLPMSTPILPPATWVAYTKALHLYSGLSNAEMTESGPLPQFYADRFGWQEQVDEVTRIYRSLTPAEQARTSILCSNYGEASALNFLGHGLPFALSGQNNYYLWGPHGATGEIVIGVNGGSLADMQAVYQDVQIAGHTANPWSMPYERRTIYLSRGRRANLSATWAEQKRYE